MSKFSNGDLVADKFGAVWRIVYDGGMAECITPEGPWSGGINWLENERGPLRLLDLLTYVVENQTIQELNQNLEGVLKRNGIPVSDAVLTQLRKVVYEGVRSRVEDALPTAVDVELAKGKFFPVGTTVTMENSDKGFLITIKRPGT